MLHDQNTLQMQLMLLTVKGDNLSHPNVIVQVLLRNQLINRTEFSLAGDNRRGQN